MTRASATPIRGRALLVSALLLATACASTGPAQRHGARQQRVAAALSPAGTRFGRGAPLRPPGLLRQPARASSDLLSGPLASGVMLDGRSFGACYGWGGRPSVVSASGGSTFHDVVACHEPWALFQP